MDRLARCIVRLLPLPALLLLSGCQWAVLDPKGPIGMQERSIIITATVLMLLVVVPVIALILIFAWRYRASNENADYRPDWAHSNRIEAVVWLIPCVIVAALGVIAWRSSHTLDPYRPLDSKVKPIRIDAVALDWKWLFIYPDQKVATVNQVAFPANVPVEFHITSATVMNAFFIPQLGSQIYAMAGMQTQLHLLASEPGTYQGLSSNYSGDGFSGMTFKAIALPQQGFDAWLAKVKASQQTLGAGAYAQLARASENNPVGYYSQVEPGLFADIVASGMRDLAATGEELIMLGKLTLAAIPYQNPIIFGAIVFMALVVVAVPATITVLGKWKYLWTEWLTSVDHKKIGAMYVILAGVMLLRGFADAIMMRAQQALAYGPHTGYLPPEHFDQVFSAHGTIMIFFMAMPFMIGLMNCVLPLQIGARDVAFPFLNSLSLWLTVVGAMLVNLSLAVGNFARTGWLAYPPLSELHFSPGVGVDYYIWALQISGIGTTLTGVNFIATILRMRAPGMTLMRMPVFTWTALCTNILIVAAFPVLTVSLALLTLDRYLGMHFFTSSLGGDPMMYINLIWIWGHPEVYILILPAFGIFSEIIATFSGKRLFGYTSMVFATMAIALLSFLVWLHHFFTMGSGADVNAFFGITTMVIAVPTGVKIFNWLFTMYRGRVRFESPVLWTIGFMITFVIGGMSGVLMAVPPADFVLHNSLFLVAHFHNVIIGGVVFGAMAGLTYWFPKVFGFRLHEPLGKAAFWCWLVGFYVAFMPLYVLGLMGATRRMDHYDNPAWQPLFVVAAIGAVIIFCGIMLQLAQVVVSVAQRERARDLSGDPWGGRTLEWATSSPPPAYNFARIPVVRDRDAFWDMKQRGVDMKAAVYRPIHMPRNTATGFVMAVFIGLAGFAMIWHIWWLAIGGFAAAMVSLIRHAFDDDRAYYVEAEEVRRTEVLRGRAQLRSV